MSAKKSSIPKEERTSCPFCEQLYTKSNLQRHIGEKHFGRPRAGRRNGDRDNKRLQISSLQTDMPTGTSSFVPVNKERKLPGTSLSKTPPKAHQGAGPFPKLSGAFSEALDLSIKSTKKATKRKRTKDIPIPAIPNVNLPLPANPKNDSVEPLVKKKKKSHKKSKRSKSDSVNLTSDNTSVQMPVDLESTSPKKKVPVLVLKKLPHQIDRALSVAKEVLKPVIPCPDQPSVSPPVDTIEPLDDSMSIGDDEDFQIVDEYIADDADEEDNPPTSPASDPEVGTKLPTYCLIPQRSEEGPATMIVSLEELNAAIANPLTQEDVERLPLLGDENTEPTDEDDDNDDDVEIIEVIAPPPAVVTETITESRSIEVHISHRAPVDTDLYGVPYPDHGFGQVPDDAPTTLHMVRSMDQRTVYQHVTTDSNKHGIPDDLYRRIHRINCYLLKE